MGTPSCIRSIVGRNVVMRLVTVHYPFEKKLKLTPTWKADKDSAGEKFLVGCATDQSTAVNNTFIVSNVALSPSTG